MNQVRDNYRSARRRPRERGSSRLNFLILMAVIVAAAYAGYQYVPVAYQASQLKVFNLTSYGAPPDTRITVANRESRLEAHVQYTVPVPLLVTTYEYKFDHTASSNNLLPGGG
jgi:hypothetical protein